MHGVCMYDSFLGDEAELRLVERQPRPMQEWCTKALGFDASINLSAHTTTSKEIKIISEGDSEPSSLRRGRLAERNR